MLTLLVLFAGTAVSCGAYAAVETGEDRYAGQLMDRYAAEITAAVTDRVERYGDTLTDLAYAIGAQSDLTRDDLNRITAGIVANRLPGASGVGFVVPVPTRNVVSVQRFWRGQGFDGLVLTPLPGVVDHEFVIFEKGFDGRKQMHGVDLTASVQASAVLGIARDSGQLAISAPYYLLRDDEMVAEQKQSSVVLATPVYTGLGSAAPDRFVGWSTMGLRGQDFMSQTLLDRGQGVVQAQLLDPAGTATVLADVAPGTRVADRDLERRTSITAGQRLWEISMWPTNRLLNVTDRGLSRLTLASGVGLTIMLAAVTAVMAGSRNRALEQVDRATAELRRDISRREQVENQLREREDELRYLAFHDQLTGLANRLLFYDRLRHALTTHARGGRHFAVLFIDLDGFKKINDDLGHDAGDTVLRAIAGRLRTGLRASDTVARFGGDEFAIILEGLTNVTDARPTAERIIVDAQEPIMIGGVPARVSASIGIALNHPGSGTDDIIREADTAMYAAKNSGKSRYVEAVLP
ncbi:sensor domain-containing diguanylate cyclase [Actinoplanes couchii]|uniref:sensor domain-containing diguanylate cyclase n=1 Tax=Actinoplanes couchii TaxID=403638 RepID=UPI00194385D6|nr:sensor domain-containing diguanylate cyclase [Actinoplanes couchii]MDR6324132.1 diguanylate cyclase (GGDEF)-like protein [Actinoplanes couchii]